MAAKKRKPNRTCTMTVDGKVVDKFPASKLRAYHKKMRHLKDVEITVNPDDPEVLGGKAQGDEKASSQLTLFGKPEGQP